MKKLLSFCLALLLLAGLSVIPTSAEAITPDTAWYGDGTQDRFELKTAADVLGFFKLLSQGTANFEGKTVALTADVDLNPGWDASKMQYGTNMLAAVSPAYSFKGTFDGQGHTVSGLCAATSADHDTGIFGQAVAGADVTIRNVRFLNSFVNLYPKWRCAVLMNGDGGKLTIENVYSEMTINGKVDAGTSGSAFTSNMNVASVTVIRNCVFAGKIVTATGCGAFIGRNDGTATLENCAFYGTIEGATNNVCSGLVDDNRGTLTIKNCISAGTVAANGNGNIDVVIRNPQGSVTAENNRFICNGSVANSSVKVATAMTAEELADFYNYAKEIDGFEGWDVIAGKAYPTTLAWGVKGTNSDAVCLKNWQKNDGKDGTWSIRLIGGVDSLDYDSLELCLTVKDNEGKTGTVKESIQTVWSSILAGEETVTAGSLNTGYLWGVVLSNIPEAQNAIGLDAKVYTVKNGVKTLVSVQTVLVGGAEQ